MFEFSWKFKLIPLVHVINLKQIIHALATREWNKRLRLVLKTGVFPLRGLYHLPIASTRTALSLVQVRVKLYQMKELMTQSLNVHLPVVTTKVLTQLWWVFLFCHSLHIKRSLVLLLTIFSFQCSAPQVGSLSNSTIGIQPSSLVDCVIKYSHEFYITIWGLETTFTLFQIHKALSIEICRYSNGWPPCLLSWRAISVPDVQF